MCSADHSMRMRGSLHCGLASFDPHGITGDAVNTACRLVDLPALRTVLTTCERANLAFIVSDDVYRSVISQGFRSIDRAAYRHVRFDMKNLVDFPAWIHVPGYPTPHGLPPEATGSAAGARAGDPGPAGAQPQPEQRAAPAGTAAGHVQSGGIHFAGGSTVTVNGDMVARDKNVHL